jgi:hypothetical protein
MTDAEYSHLFAACADDRARLLADSNVRIAEIYGEARASFDRKSAPVVADVIEIRAQRYAQSPRLLDNHFPTMDLRFADARTLLARVDGMLEQYERGTLPRWYGHGGETVELNLRAARLYGERMMAEELREVA